MRETNRTKIVRKNLNIENDTQKNPETKIGV